MKKYLQEHNTCSIKDLNKLTLDAIDLKVEMWKPYVKPVPCIEDKYWEVAEKAETVRKFSRRRGIVK